VSAFADAMRAVRQVVLMQSHIERLQGDFDRLADDLRGLKDYASAIDSRVSHMEGFMRGAEAASKSRLPRR
jgi:hypothetical protein